MTPMQDYCGELLLFFSLGDSPEAIARQLPGRPALGLWLPARHPLTKVLCVFQLNFLHQHATAIRRRRGDHSLNTHNDRRQNKGLLGRQPKLCSAESDQMEAL